MRIYTVHYRPEAGGGDIVPVKEGFCWPAFLFGPLWALWHGLWAVALWLLALIAVVGAANAVFALDAVTATVLTAGAAVAVGGTANDLRRWTLERRGFSEEGVVMGGGEDSALRRFLANTPMLTGGLQ
ncbi:MAG: DUF2628 domain-containing protein [Ochrobactrum anthropi]|uniref:DUF2628 domain-containing protein n=1 Tax=Brucella anthropi TaxID=529 RepID=A0A8I0TC13_BRUAN|nr:DUF2628 domain-containing protein [Brucella anthropi]MBE0562786.1 DUF2628 domain-containing protein [Brucella anthropi]